MKEKAKHIQTALEYTEAMLKDAKAGNWENVIKLETRRAVILKNLSLIPHGNENVAEIKSKISKILKINSLLEDIVVETRNSAGSEINTINKGRHAVSLYMQHAV